MDPQTKQAYKSRLMNTKGEIEKVGKDLPKVIEHLDPYLSKLITEGQYVEYILIGASVIEYFLLKVLLQYQHSINISLFANQIAVNSDMILEFEAPIGARSSIK